MKESIRDMRDIDIIMMKLICNGRIMADDGALSSSCAVDLCCRGLHCLHGAPCAPSGTKDHHEWSCSK
jgi:hypothetical protein